MQTSNKLLIIHPKQEIHILKALASEIRVTILHALQEGPLNINDLAKKLDLPQSTVATNVLTLEKYGLVTTEIQKASKGNQKVCHPVYNEFIVLFHDGPTRSEDVITVEMPIGLYIKCCVSPPCGLCSPQKIIGYLDSPESFLEPERVKAGLIWFETGKIQYQFPNNAFNSPKKIRKIEISMELSSETPGTNSEWSSDIGLQINSKDVGIWTSPGDFGDKRGKLTPEWWKLEGSQYGILTTWSVTDEGSFLDDTKISDTTLADLDLDKHHSIKVAIEVSKDAQNVGGINIFGSSFGNYEQDIILKIYF